ncbi:MAG: sigma-70 family RNA polymerase sigma factor [Acidobacteria bacterium]|nr:sigma-70 family RNA polymerase sigma factor [Acidobacteriota bacterium]
MSGITGVDGIDREKRERMALTELATGVVDRAMRGDEEAFQLIFTRYGRPILSFIQNMVQNRALAEELAQETFVRAYRNLGRLRDASHLSTWLFGIALNVARESAREHRRDARRIALDEPASLELESTARRPEGELLDRELNGVIAQVLRELDDDKRIVFTLKILHEMSYEEISRITGHSIGKLKTDLHRARLVMRRRIAPYLRTD